jgi:hypothetical protein
MAIRTILHAAAGPTCGSPMGPPFLSGLDSHLGSRRTSATAVPAGCIQIIHYNNARESHAYNQGSSHLRECLAARTHVHRTTFDPVVTQASVTLSSAIAPEK